MKGGFTKLFGHIPKVAVLEAFSQNYGYEMAASEIQEISGVSKRATYLIISKLVREGILLETKNRPKLFSLNMNDVRAKMLATMEPLLEMGDLESLLKEQSDIPQSSLLPGGIMDDSGYKEIEKSKNYIMYYLASQPEFEIVNQNETNERNTNGTDIYPAPSSA